MLTDDIASHDKCCIQLDNIISDTFSLPDGTAQGRKLSMMFNNLMKCLHDILVDLHLGVSVGTSRWPARVLDRANSIVPACGYGYNARRVCSLALQLRSMDPGTKADEAANLLSTLTSGAERIAALDMSAAFKIADIMYVDDVVAPVSSYEQCNLFF